MRDHSQHSETLCVEYIHSRPACTATHKCTSARNSSPVTARSILTTSQCVLLGPALDGLCPLPHQMEHFATCLHTYLHVHVHTYMYRLLTNNEIGGLRKCTYRPHPPLVSSHLTVSLSGRPFVLQVTKVWSGVKDWPW